MDAQVIFSAEEFLSNASNYLPSEEAGKVYLNLALLSMYALRTVRWIRKSYNIEQLTFVENELQLYYKCKKCERIFIERNKMKWDAEVSLFSPIFADGRDGAKGTARTVTMSCLTKHTGRCNSQPACPQLQNTRRKASRKNRRKEGDNVCEQPPADSSTVPTAFKPSCADEDHPQPENATTGNPSSALDPEFLVDFDLSDFCASPRECGSSYYQE